MRIGQEVICINDVFDIETIRRVPNLPKRDTLYTIKNIVLAIHKNGYKGLILEELVNPPLINDLNPVFSFVPSFNIERFRPLIEVEDLEEIDENLLVKIN